MFDLDSAFARDYREARDKFHAAATAHALQVERHVHPSARGAQDEELSIDVVLFGDRDAEQLLFVTSGLHGVEGFCGSGCQVALLRDEFALSAVRQSKTSVLFCHAVNPYGFSHLRRTNEDNVDLNRNFCNFAEPLKSNDQYAQLHAIVVPASWPPTPENSAALASSMARFGLPALQAAISRGQSEFADGLFYSGRSPAWSNVVLRDVLACHGRSRRRLAWIDLHTGLGPWGHGEKIHLGPDDEVMLARGRAWFGDDVTTMYDGSASSAVVDGVCYHAVLDACPDAEYTGITLEFGTRPLTEVMQALRAEQWLANHDRVGEPLRGAIKRQMRDAFYEDSPSWRAMTYGQARVVVLQAVRGLDA
jgi:hypothetical protein